MHKPAYYNNFICTSSSCPFTCCQQWRIAVDDDTFYLWKKLQIPESCYKRDCSNKNAHKGNSESCYNRDCSNSNEHKENSVETPSDSTLDQFTHADEAGSSISLLDNGFCPYLNEKGLCDIVLTYGEETISHTCHTFPREEHVFESQAKEACEASYRKVEKTLALGCPAVVDLLWNSNKFEIEETSDEQTHLQKCSEESVDSGASGKNIREQDLELLDEQRLFLVRDKLMNFISDSHYPLGDSIRMMFYILLDLFDRFEECGDIDFIDDVFIDTYFTEQFLDELYKQISRIPPEEADNIYEQDELFLDISDSYKKKGMYANVLNPLLELASKYEDESSENLFISERKAFEPIWNGLEDKIRLVVAEEIYSTLYMPEGDLYSMVLKAQWLGMTYAVLKQMIFLTWMNNDKSITFEQIREVICVLIRMTGYSEEDIEEYLENSFEDIIWDWGYMNLILD